MRTFENFDRDWQFHLGDLSVPRRQRDKKIPLANPMDAQPDDWQALDLPHDWGVELDFVPPSDLENATMDTASCHGYLPTEVGFYRKEFNLPTEARSGRILLEFEGIYRNCTIWVNGHYLLQHESGYTSFFCDLTEVAHCGGRNCILIRVDAREDEGWWYEGAGIYRHVRLIFTGNVHLAPWGHFVFTPEIEKTRAQVRVRTRLVNTTDKDTSLMLNTRIIDPNGAAVAMHAVSGKVPAMGEVEFEQNLAVAQPELWSPEHPQLYRAITKVRQNREKIEQIETVFGIRSIVFTADRGVLLNGIPYPVKGVCVHQDFAGVGVALPDRLHAARVEMLKEMGANAWRCAHHPPAPALLDACDRLGMLVLDENRQFSVAPNDLADLESMVRRDRNHPCVFLWSLENEEPLEGTEVGARIIQRLARHVRHLDPTRPVTAAINHDWNEGGYVDHLDVVGYNYGHREQQDSRDHERFPQRKSIGTETNSTTTTRGVYRDDPKRGYCSCYQEKIVRWGCDCEQAWNDLLRHPELSGIFVWTGFDYRGEPTPYIWPNVNSHFGLMDLAGFPKDIYYYYRSVWREEPMIHLFPHWTWPGREGKRIRLRCYSNCDAVELFVNGHSAGRQLMPRAGHVEWNAPYHPGELLARGYAHGAVAAETRIVTAGAPARLQVKSDRHQIQADNVDLALLRITVVDNNNEPVPTAANPIIFSISGPGRVIGVGNGDPSCHESCLAHQRPAFNGCCLAIIQHSGQPGEIRVTASSPGLASAEICIPAGMKD